MGTTSGVLASPCQEPVAHRKTGSTVTDKSREMHQPRAVQDLIEMAQSNSFSSTPFLEADLTWIQSIRSSIYRGIIRSWSRIVSISAHGYPCATGSCCTTLDIFVQSLCSFSKMESAVAAQINSALVSLQVAREKLQHTSDNNPSSRWHVSRVILCLFCRATC
jgi:hypothetical protein